MHKLTLHSASLKEYCAAVEQKTCFPFGAEIVFKLSKFCFIYMGWVL